MSIKRAMFVILTILGCMCASFHANAACYDVSSSSGKLKKCTYQAGGEYFEDKGYSPENRVTWFDWIEGDPLQAPPTIDSGYLPFQAGAGYTIPTALCASPCETTFTYNGMTIYYIRLISKAGEWISDETETGMEIDHEKDSVPGNYFYGIGKNSSGVRKVVLVKPVDLGGLEIQGSDIMTDWNCRMTGKNTIDPLASSKTIYVASGSNNVTLSCSFPTPSPETWTTTLSNPSGPYVNFNGDKNVQVSSSGFSLVLDVTGKYNVDQKVAVKEISSVGTSKLKDTGDISLNIKLRPKDFTQLRFVKEGYDGKKCPNGSLPGGNDGNECANACTAYSDQEFDNSPGVFKCVCTDSSKIISQGGAYSGKCVPKSCNTAYLKEADDGTIYCDPPEAGGCSYSSECLATQTCEGGKCVDKPLEECSSDSQCPSGEMCSYGQCVPSQSASCSDSDDCTGGLICGNAKVCILGTGSCQDGLDCREGMVCSNSRCISKVSGCSSDSECATGFTCTNRMCVVARGGCSSNEECGADQTCTNGQCIDTGYGCKSDNDCPGGQECNSENECVQYGGDGTCEEAGRIWDEALGRCVCDIDNDWYMEDSVCMQDKEAATCESQGGVIDENGDCSNPLRTACLEEGNKWVGQECLTVNLAKNGSSGCSMNRNKTDGTGGLLFILLFLIPFITFRRVSNRPYKRL